MCPSLYSFDGRDDEAGTDRPTPTAGRGDAPWTVARLAEEIKGALAANLPGKVRVVGEVSNLSDRNHWFFSLKDEKAAIRSVMFASAARRVGFPVRDGMEVVATGRIDFYDAPGQRAALRRQARTRRRGGHANSRCGR